MSDVRCEHTRVEMNATDLKSIAVSGLSENNVSTTLTNEHCPLMRNLSSADADEMITKRTMETETHDLSSPRETKRRRSLSDECRVDLRVHGGASVTRNEDKEKKRKVVRVMRKDMITGEWVLYVSGGFEDKPRQLKHKKSVGIKVGSEPAYLDACPFCARSPDASKDDKCPRVGDVLRYDVKGGWKSDWSVAGSCGTWLLRCVRNIFPAFVLPRDYYAADGWPHGFFEDSGSTNESNDSAVDSLYIQVTATGICEVIIEYPTHNMCMGNCPSSFPVKLLLECMVRRCRALRRERNLRYVSLFKQHKCGSIVHAHSQIISAPFTPSNIKTRLLRSQYIHDKYKCCITCRTLVQDPLCEIGCERFVLASLHFVVSVPYAASVGHTLEIAPRRHCCDILSLTDTELEDLARVVQTCAKFYYECLDDVPYNFAVFTCPNQFRDAKEKSLYERVFHWTAMFCPYRKSGPDGYRVGTHIKSCSMLPEDSARIFREWLKTKAHGQEKAQAHD